MNSLFPTYIQWRISLKHIVDPYDMFGINTAKKIKKSIEKITSSPYRFVRDTVDAAYLEKFIPLYEQNIHHKKHGRVSPVFEHVHLRGTSMGKEYRAISLYKHDTYMGGLIYRHTSTYTSTAYKFFPYTLDISLPISPSFVAEWHLFREALHHNHTHIIHGKDRNPYGSNSDIGLAMYKLQIGCAPFVSKDTELIFSSVDTLPKTEDLLIFLGEKKDDPIHESILMTNLSEDIARKKYAILFSKPFLHTHIYTR